MSLKVSGMSLLVQSDSARMLSVCQLRIKSKHVALERQLHPVWLLRLSVKFDFSEKKVVRGSHAGGFERRLLI